MTVTIPVLGRVACNERLLPQLRGAMKDLVSQGLESTIHSFDGCFVARFDPSSLSGSISLNAWGAAVDINADTNRDRIAAACRIRDLVSRDGGAGASRGAAT